MLSTSDSKSTLHLSPPSSTTRGPKHAGPASGGVPRQGQEVWHLNPQPPLPTALVWHQLIRLQKSQFLG